MRITPASDAYTFPRFSDIMSVAIDGREEFKGHIALCRVEMKTLLDIRKESGDHLGNVRATPRYFAILYGQIIFYPWPDRDYEIRVRYTPPIAEF